MEDMYIYESRAVRCLPQLRSVECLSLHGILCLEAAAALEDGLAQAGQPCLQGPAVLNIGYKRTEGVDRFFRALGRTFPRIGRLEVDLSYCSNLGDDGLGALVRGLSVADCARGLHTLNLAGCCITGDPG